MKKLSYDPGIDTLIDVENFFDFLVNNNIYIHHDDSFANSIDHDTLPVILSEKDIEQLDNKMDDCFDVCTEYNTDIYELMYNAVTRSLTKSNEPK